MAKTHKASIILAIIVALVLLVGMIIGNHGMPPIFNTSSRTVRELCVALWVFLLPAWFSLEEYWAPDSDPELKQFRKSQQFARMFWTLLSGCVAIIIDFSPKALGH